MEAFEQADQPALYPEAAWPPHSFQRLALWNRSLRTAF
jgi:hypothetical protein